MPPTDTPDTGPASLRWARLRFAIVGPLLAAPPEPGELASRLNELASKPYRHPTTGETLRYSVKTLERWYYSIRNEADPVGALARKVPSHAGTHPSIGEALATEIRLQHQQHPRWSFQLHYDNLVVRVGESPEIGSLPAYATVCRFMKDQGLLRWKRRPSAGEPRGGPRESRSFEFEHVHGLWHLDFHTGSRKVLMASGEWKTAYLLGILDDCSRLCCHCQWYLDETAESLCHGLSQAIQKRGLPRALLTDNGSAMVARETREGLERLSITHFTTLPHSPEQNGKQERFWGQVEGRLMAMLEGEAELTLPLLNRATLAWVEQGYHRTRHEDLGEPPLERYLRGPAVDRPSPDSEALRRAFRTEVLRTQRRSDGTVTVEGVRFEVPAAFRAMTRLSLRVARWDLTSAHLVDRRSGAHLALLLPQDKAKNADRRRRALPPGETPSVPPPPAGMAPLLRKFMADYAATGLPAGYLPRDGDSGDQQDGGHSVRENS